MDGAKGNVSAWQSLLSEFRGVFTLGGWARFAQWATGTVLCAEEHTITQILTGLGLEAQWRSVEHFAAYGSCDRTAVERQLMRVVEQEHPARWGGYHPVAIDDTKEHRTSADVWGTCTFRYKCLECCWSVSGLDKLMHAYVFEVPGYDKLWATITSARNLSAAQALAADSGGFRQEDGFRDHRQRLGMEESRAWTKEPILRTFQVQMIALTLLRLMQFRSEATDDNTWCVPPPWNPGKRHASILDLRRLFWKHRERFSQVVAAWDDLKKPPQTKFRSGRTIARAA